MKPAAYEVNFDGIVGPTHNYAGLSYGNLASQKHGLSVSSPRRAALEGLAKMKYLADLGLKQAVLPPQDRPDLRTLRRMGFGGSDARVVEKAWKEDRRLLSAVYSASSMWAANAATVAPGADTADGRVHFTPANLVTQFHRSLEPSHTARMLKAIFGDPSAFVHHDPLPAANDCADEGAANHTRLCAAYGQPGVEMFVYGRDASDRLSPTGFPARQTFEASAAVARLHELRPDATLLVRQNAAAINAGAFHNDVVAVGNQNVFFYHASAYADPASVAERLRQAFSRVSGSPLHLIEVSEAEIPLDVAIETYLFNSQIVSLPQGGMVLIAPVECRESKIAEQFIRRLIEADNPIGQVHYLDVRQSMRNGGGPACLRLRVVLTDRELSLTHSGVFLTDALYAQLTDCVSRHYRDELRPDDLADPHLIDESRTALSALNQILALPD